MRAAIGNSSIACEYPTCLRQKQHRCLTDDVLSFSVSKHLFDSGAELLRSSLDSSKRW
jgi:hypothetical protein